MCKSCLTNTEGCARPDETQIALYAKHVERGSIPKPGQLPKWLRDHFRAVALPKPFVPDYSCTTAKCPKGHRIPDGCVITATRVPA